MDDTMLKAPRKSRATEIKCLQFENIKGGSAKAFSTRSVGMNLARRLNAGIR